MDIIMLYNQWMPIQIHFTWQKVREKDIKKRERKTTIKKLSSIYIQISLSETNYIDFLFRNVSHTHEISCQNEFYHSKRTARKRTMDTD